MGKARRSSWYSAVRRAFNCNRRSVHRQEHEREEKEKPEKRIWSSRKLTGHSQQCHHANAVSESTGKQTEPTLINELREATAEAEGRRTSEAKPAIKSIQATRNLFRKHHAALIIQTAFRGYLARAALRALQGIVKIQALVRGYNVRTKAKTSLECMKALTKVQPKMCEQYSRLSQDEARKSLNDEINSLWDKYKDIHPRKPTAFALQSANINKIVDQRDVIPYTIEELEVILGSKSKATLCQEEALAYGSSQKTLRFQRNGIVNQEKHRNGDIDWLGHWMESIQFGGTGNELTIKRSNSRRDVNDESLLPNHKTPTKLQNSNHRDSQNSRHSLHVTSPLNRAHYVNSHRLPMTPLSNTRPLQVRSASPRYARSRSQSTTNTPRLHLDCPSTACSYRYRREANTTTPNYMATTESAKARAQTQSTPRQRHATKDRQTGCSVKKRLSYPNRDADYHGSIYGEYNCVSKDLKSASFRSLQEGIYEVDRRTLCTYNGNTGGEISPASTSHIRRLLS